ncbi:MAG: MdtA/MuxA family multidrug efflux RND transporter periplasmic adaptor subunit [Desulfovibrionaceae bacterium]
MRRTTLFRLLAVLLLCGLAASLVLLRKDGAPRAMRTAPQPVRAATALRQDVPEYLAGLGTVRPSADALVQSRVDGTLIRLHFTEGQHVQAGELLAEIDPRPFEAEVAEARGTLAKDQALLDNARLDLGRYAALSRNKYIAGQEYTAQQAKVREYEGTVASDKAKLRAAELQLAYSRITAPVSGRTGLRQVEEGNMVRSSDSAGIVRVSEIQPCHVLFTLPESKLAVILEGARQHEEDSRMEVQVWDRNDSQMLDRGFLVSMDNSIDTATGTVKLKAEFANRERRLFPNQFVNARLLARTFRQAVTVPAAAIQLGMSGTYVFIIREGKVHMAAVEVPFSTDALAVVTTGLAADDRVVVDGVDRLREGSAVEVVAEVETPPAVRSGAGTDMPAADKDATPAAR